MALIPTLARHVCRSSVGLLFRTAGIRTAAFALLPVLLIVSWMHATFAQSQATRTYVSGRGNDNSPCTVNAPCKTFQAAAAKTAAGGQLIALDSANYGAVTLNKAISIISGRGASGVLATGSSSGITISAGPNDVITLEGLEIDGARTGSNGILFTGGATLNIKNSIIRGFETGIKFQPGAASSLLVEKTLVSNNAVGIAIEAQATSRAVLNDVQAVNNTAGIVARGTGSNGRAVVTLHSCLVANSMMTGVQSAGFSEISVENCTVANNNVGLEASGNGANVTVSGSTVTGNGTGWQAVNGGQLVSPSNNATGGNVLANNTAPGATAQSSSPSGPVRSDPIPPPPEAPQVPTLARNIVTDFGATCDGTANDVNAFNAFKTWALANQADNQVVLTIPSGAKCMFLTNAARSWTAGIKNLLVMGYGATISNTGNPNPGFFLGGAGMKQNASSSARTATVEAGSNCVTLLNPAQTSLFTVGNYAIMTGFDLQGIWKSSYGFPPNFHYFDYVLVSSINAGTGAVCFTTTLSHTYKSTWPHYAGGNAFEVDQGGPATLYFLDPSWNTTIEFRGLTIEQDNFQTYANGKSITYRDVKFTGAHCGVPTQNLVWRAINTDMSNCNMEVDKLIGEMVLDGVTIRMIHIQSSSIDRLTMKNSTVTKQLSGTPKVANIADSTIDVLQIGAFAYGRSDEFICTNCILPNLSGGGILEKGPGDIGVNIAYSMSNGIISYPNGVLVTGAADNGSGRVRLAVTSTAGFVTGQTVNISGVSGTWEANGGNRLITVIDDRHIDLPQITFTRAYVSGGAVSNLAPRWAVPGTNLMWAGAYESQRAFKVVDVTQDENNTYIHTTWSGGFPSGPLSGGKLNIRVHSAPKVTCTNCTGSPDAVELSQAPAGAPLFSYSKRTYTSENLSTTPAPKSRIWGAISSIKFDVTKPYSGIVSTLTMNALSQFNNYPTIKTDNSILTYGPKINLKAAGLRTITSAGITGMQSGDSGLAVPEAVWFTGLPPAGPTISSNISSEGTAPSPSITIEIKTDQGISP